MELAQEQERQAIQKREAKLLEEQEREAKLRQIEIEFKQHEVKRKETFTITRNEKIISYGLDEQRRLSQFKLLEGQLGEILEKIQEANTIAIELKRDVRF